MTDTPRKSFNSPQKKSTAVPAHKTGDAGKAKTDQRTKIKSASRYEENKQKRADG